MIIHKLVAQHLRHGEGREFSRLQAQDAIRWMRSQGVPVGPSLQALDLGAGSGIFGGQLALAGCEVTYADEKNYLDADLRNQHFVQFQVGVDPWPRLGEFDLVVFSNVLEHIDNPQRFVSEAPRILKSGGYLYLSWTNWLSPWGGHDFSPFHYLGSNLGPKVNDRLRKRKTIFTMGKNLFPTYVGETLRWVRSHPELQIVAKAPRYYTELGWLVSVPLVREFLCWNVALLIQRKMPSAGRSKTMGSHLNS